MENTLIGTTLYFISNITLVSCLVTDQCYNGEITVKDEFNILRSHHYYTTDSFFLFPEQAWLNTIKDCDLDVLKYENSVKEFWSKVQISEGDEYIYYMRQYENATEILGSAIRYREQVKSEITKLLK